jgi:DNA-binding transcriptional MerR regulator
MNDEVIYLTISKTSNKLDVLPHVLRFWEKKFILLNPKKSKGGRRYYSNSDIDILIIIKDLLYNKGFTIKGAVNYINLKYNKKNIENEASTYTISKTDLNETIRLVKEGINILKKKFILIFYFVNMDNILIVFYRKKSK